MPRVAQRNSNRQPLAELVWALVFEPQVKSTAEDSDTADALRAVPDKIREKNAQILILSGDLVTDINLKV